MLLSAGLAIGTKPTTMPLLALVVTVTLLVMRERLTPLVRPLALATAVAFFVGGSWYLRNLVEHGSPIWPFAATPWGDPVPSFLDRTYPSLLARIETTLEGRLDGYLAHVAGGLLLLAGGLTAPLVTRHRAVLGIAAAIGLTLVLWANARGTGASANPAFGANAPLSNTRYLLPAMAAGALALALAPHERGVKPAIALALLGGALAVSLGQHALGDFPVLPSLTVAVVPGAAIGGAAAALAPRLPRPRWARGALAVTVAAVVLGALLAPAGSGYVNRHIRATDAFYGELWTWLDSRPESRHRPIAMAPELMGILVGDRLERPLELIPAREPCALVERRRRREWVILRQDPAFRSAVGFTAGRCLVGEPPTHEIAGYRIYGATEATVGNPTVSRSSDADRGISGPK
jgi:hypothetical protein